MYHNNPSHPICLSSKVIFGLQLATLGFILGDLLNITSVPIMRGLLFSIYLSFIPGYLLLNILDIKEINLSEVILYSIGLSISILMFMGYSLNGLLLFAGYPYPLSKYSIFVCISLVVTVMAFYCYKKKLLEKPNYNNYSISYISEILIPEILILILFFILNFIFKIPYWQLFISAYIFSLTFLKKIHPKFYPLIIIIVSILFLLLKSLRYKYLWGVDLHYEFNTVKFILENQYWNNNSSSSLNAMLSVVILPIIYSNLLDVDIIWIYKIIYPLLFSLVPLGLYNIYLKQTNSMFAFLATFFFISLFTFSGEMLALPRQMIAELFLVLLFMLLVDSDIEIFSKSILLLLFTFSMAVSHYSVSYFYIFFITFVWAVNLFLNVYKKHNVSHLSPQVYNGNSFNITYIVLTVVFVTSWYIFIASGSTFNTLTTVLNGMYNTLFTEFFSQDSRDTALLTVVGVVQTRTLSMEIMRYFQLVTMFFIIVGSILVIFLKVRLKLTREFIFLIIASLLLLFLSFIVPHFASSLNMTRIYHILLLILSPICIVGGYFIIDSVIKAYDLLVEAKNKHQKFNIYKLFPEVLLHEYSSNNCRFNKQRVIRVLTLVLIGYYFANVGLFGSILSDFKLVNSDAERSPSFLIHDQDIYCVSWLSDRTDKEPVYSDSVSKYPLVDGLSDLDRIKLYRPKNSLDNGYVFLNYENCIFGVMKIPIYTAGSKNPLFETTIFENTPDASKVYNDGAILYKFYF